MSKKISASILSADFSKIGAQVQSLEDAGVEWLHLDVMDGEFVPNISFGIPVIQSLRMSSKMFFDAHLMVGDPIRYVKEFKKAGADLITVHFEACEDVMECVSEIRKTGAKVGVSIKPSTPLSSVEAILEDIDLILLMGVEPGFGGQKFQAETLDKIRKIRKIIDSRGLKTLIEVDGGVNEETVADISAAGADVLVVGSFLFRFSGGISAAVSEIRKHL